MAWNKRADRHWAHGILKLILLSENWCIDSNFTEISSFGDRQWSLNIGSGNGLVPLGTKPLPGPMLTMLTDTLLFVGNNELMIHSQAPQKPSHSLSKPAVRNLHVSNKLHILKISNFFTKVII